MKQAMLILWVACCVAATRADAQIDPVQVTFDDREYNGWTILGFQDQVWQPEGGNPGAHLRFFFDNFLIRIFNRESGDFIGDFTQKGPVQISGDLRWGLINFSGTDVTRDLFFAMWDEYINDQGNLARHVVLRPLGKVRGQGLTAPWRTSTIRVPNPSGTKLPGGWLYWDGNADVEPTRTLPAGLDWRDIMASIDRIEWTTATPGFFFGFTFFDVSLDNARIEPLRGSDGNTVAAQAELRDAERFGLDVTGGPGEDGSPGRSSFAPDGAVDRQDLAQFREWVYDGELLADVTTTGAVEGDWNWGISDGRVDEYDLMAYEAAWSRTTRSATR